MLNRRYLRIKVMQALYAFFQSEGKDLAKAEVELFRNIDKIYDLYVLQLLILPEVRDIAENVSEEAKKKRLPTENDLNPNRKFLDNKIILLLQNNEFIAKYADAKKLNWQNEYDLVKKIFTNIKNSKEYEAYIAAPDASFKMQQDFIVEMYETYVAEYEILIQHFEEKNIHWGDDIYLVHHLVAKTIAALEEDSEKNFSLMTLYKDAEEDRKFIKDLFRKTILNDEENSKIIADKTSNWDMERLAFMDLLLMRMAVAEVLYFPSIPVKVTLNEYIELSKMYSTPKSKVFINGVLDKLVADFKANDQIKKVGRGLLEE
ncbi:MAG: transcription antitermination factor NusB [Bacteroidia bacterium]